MSILDEFRETPLPPSRVDVPAAVRAGRRRQRTRFAAVALSAAAVLAAGVAAAPQVLRLSSGADRGGGGQQAATAPISCTVPGPVEDEWSATATGKAPATFSPLQRWVDASSVAGYRLENYTTAGAWQRLELKSTSGNRTVEITLYAKDGAPVFAAEPGTAPTPVDPTTGTPAEPVRGSQAWWLPGHQGIYQFEAARLGWNWAPGAWAFVAAADTPDNEPSNSAPATPQQVAQLRAAALTAARTLRIAAGEAVRSPFTMPVPDCTHLVSTTFFQSTTAAGRPFTRFTLTFGVPGSENANPLLLPPSEGQTVSVTADSAATAESKPGSATAELDGHPAYSDGDFLVVYGVGGFAFELSCPGGADAARELFHTIEVGPGTTDATGTWTETPLER